MTQRLCWVNILIGVQHAGLTLYGSRELESLGGIIIVFICLFLGYCRSSLFSLCAKIKKKDLNINKIMMFNVPPYIKKYLIIIGSILSGLSVVSGVVVFMGGLFLCYTDLNGWSEGIIACDVLSGVSFLAKLFFPIGALLLLTGIIMYLYGWLLQRFGLKIAVGTLVVFGILLYLAAPK